MFSSRPQNGQSSPETRLRTLDLHAIPTTITYIFDIKIELSNGSDEVLSVDKDRLLVLEQLSQVIQDEEDALILVGTHHDVGLLEVLSV